MCVQVSKHYDENKTDLFFEQCFIVEGSLGCGSFGKVNIKLETTIFERTNDSQN